MKGDGFIKTIINIRGFYKYDNNQPYVEIFDMNGCKISSGYSNCGKYIVCLNKCCHYKVKVRYLCRTIVNTIYTDRCNFDIYFNITSQHRRPARTITFRLNDYYYNLPISKGVLNFG